MQKLTVIHYCLSHDVQDLLMQESISKYPNETGGLLVGYFADSCAFIQFATEPGPLALHQPQEFRRDGEFSQKALDTFVEKSAGNCDYIGEWHSHPQNTGPSSKDRYAMQWIARNRSYAVTKPILCICIRENATIWRIRLFQYCNSILQELTELT